MSGLIRQSTLAGSNPALERVAREVIDLGGGGGGGGGGGVWCSACFDVSFLIGVLP